MDKLKISITESAGRLFFIAFLLIRSDFDCFDEQINLMMETWGNSWALPPFSDRLIVDFP